MISLCVLSIIYLVSFYQVKSMPELKHGQVFPEFQLIFPGSAAKIACKGEIGLEWTRNGITLPSQKIIENEYEVEAIYQILDMDEEVEGVYKCVNGGRLPFTAEAEVYAAIVDETPDIVTPQYNVASVGDETSFTCRYRSDDIKWFFMDTTELPQYHSIYTGATLKMNVRDENGGFFFCHYVQEDGTRTLSRAFLEVNHAPSIPGEVVYYYPGEEALHSGQSNPSQENQVPLLQASAEGRDYGSFEENQSLALSVGDTQRDFDFQMAGELHLTEECPEVQLKDGMVQYSGRSSGDVISFRCNSGFVLLGQSRGICMTDMMWSGEVPVCRESGAVKMYLSNISILIIVMILSFMKLNNIIF